MFPLLYYLTKRDHYVTQDKWIVVIAKPFSYQFTETEWWNEDFFYWDPLTPGIDLVKHHYEFASEREAMLFIQSWWEKQDVDSWYNP